MTNATQTNAETKLANSRRFIMRHQAFFATVMLGLNMQQNDQVGTMGTDGKNLLWCADFIANECNQTKTSFIILHEILHVVFKHHLRRGKRDPRLWNNAADYVINAQIVHMGLTHTWSVEDFRNADRRWLLTHGDDADPDKGDEGDDESQPGNDQGQGENEGQGD